jgi:hypothetical protein
MVEQRQIKLLVVHKLALMKLKQEILYIMIMETAFIILPFIMVMEL